MFISAARSPSLILASVLTSGSQRLGLHTFEMRSCRGSFRYPKYGESLRKQRKMSKDGQKSVKTRKGDTDYVAEGNTAKAVNEWAKIDEKHSRTRKLNAQTFTHVDLLRPTPNSYNLNDVIMRVAL